MKIAYFDCFSGIAGDMALAALLDCGVPLSDLKAALASLPVEEWDISSQAVLRSGIHAQSVSISRNGQTDAEELAHAREHHHHAQDASHDHSHHDHHHHAHDEHHEHAHHHEHHHGRSMAEIRAIIEASALNERVKSNALAIFGSIARAEAYLHHSTPEEVHFHEIGGLDSLLDIVGVAWSLDFLGIDAVYASALPHSSGWVECAHGTMPVPAPATLEILKNAPWIPTDVRGELVTPTGAGILAALCQHFGPMPPLRVDTVGLGAGKKDFPTRPNILRVVIGHSTESTTELPAGLTNETLVLLETNVDDMNPQLFEAVFERLFALGALDVWTSAIGMKKGRPAQTLSVLCEPSHQNDVLSTVLRETTTLGVRISRVERASLGREMRTVETPFGPVRVKVALWPEAGLERAQPEWEDVKQRALEANVPARDVWETTLRLASAQ